MRTARVADCKSESGDPGPQLGSPPASNVTLSIDRAVAGSFGSPSCIGKVKEILCVCPSTSGLVLLYCQGERA